MSNAAPGWYDTQQGRMWWDGTQWQAPSTSPLPQRSEPPKVVLYLALLVVVVFAAMAMLAAAYILG